MTTGNEKALFAVFDIGFERNERQALGQLQLFPGLRGGRIGVRDAKQVTEEAIEVAMYALGHVRGTPTTPGWMASELSRLRMESDRRERRLNIPDDLITPAVVADVDA